MDGYVHTCILVLWLGLRHPVPSCVVLSWGEWRERKETWEVEEMTCSWLRGSHQSPAAAFKTSLLPLSATWEEAAWLSVRSYIWEASQRVHLGLKEVGVGLPLNFRVLLS